MSEKPIKDSQPKVRKVTSGPVRDKERTKERLIATVGKVIQKYGYPGLTLVNIGKESGLDRKLVYVYFGSLDNLVETYILQKDFWKNVATKKIESILEHPESIGKEEISSLLINQFETLYKDKILQKILHWELGEKNKILRNVSDQREAIGEELFKHIDIDFKDYETNPRALIALLIGGIYYLTLHGKTNGSTFCGIDINKPEGRTEIIETISNAMTLLYNNLENKK